MKAARRQTAFKFPTSWREAKGRGEAEDAAASRPRWSRSSSSETSGIRRAPSGARDHAVAARELVTCVRIGERRPWRRRCATPASGSACASSTTPSRATICISSSRRKTGPRFREHAGPGHPACEAAECAHPPPWRRVRGPLPRASAQDASRGEARVRYVLTNYCHQALEHVPAGWTDPLASARFTQAPSFARLRRSLRRRCGCCASGGDS